MVTMTPTLERAPTLSTRTLADEYFELLGLPGEALERELATIARHECELPEPMRYEAARTRLRAWLELDREERRIIGRSFTRAVEQLSHAERAALAEAERGAVTNGMSFREFRELAPALAWSAEFAEERAA